MLNQSMSTEIISDWSISNPCNCIILQYNIYRNWLLDLIIVAQLWLVTFCVSRQISSNMHEETFVNDFNAIS